MKITDFWSHFDDSRLQEEISIQSGFSTIPNCTLAELQELAINYRWLVKTHSNHLALMVSRLEESELKSLIADILNDEQGNGNYKKSHLYLWDNFLRSIGVEHIPKEEYRVDPMILVINNSSLDFILGAEGLGTECVCAVYLEVFERFINQHPFIIRNKDKIDYEFFDIHVRGEDQVHKIKIRKAVEQLIREQKINPNLVIIGYNHSKKTWRQTWNKWITFAQQVPS
ncbi:iron-containing redox enzyme family protein [Crocosphaera watsonii]|nr:iron-containing redox enzyme family protein [Crocosphaera watsonii]